MRNQIQSRKIESVTLLLAAISFGACVSCAHKGADAARASDSAGVAAVPENCKTSVAKLESKSGSSVRGDLKFVQCGTSPLRIEGTLDGLPSNSEHGFHLHQVGDCSAPDAKSAGDHFNPDGKAHGAQRTSTLTTHAGDLGNVTADANGRVVVSLTSNVLTLDAGTFSVNGHAVVVHAKSDDFKTQPSGASGDRVACGVVKSL